MKEVFFVIMKKLLRSKTDKSAVKCTDDYSFARPAESELLALFDELHPDYEKIALSLLSYMSDDDVRDWATSEGWLD